MSLASIRPRQSGPNLIAIMFPHSLGPIHDAVIRIGGKAPGGGPILSVGMSATSCCGSTPPRIVSQQSGLKPAASAEGNKMFRSLPKGLSACRAQDDALQ